MCKRILDDVPTDFPARPFCSARCKLADLDNWLGETYRISSPVDCLDPEDLADPEGSGH